MLHWRLPIDYRSANLIVDLRIDETRQIPPVPIHRGLVEFRSCLPRCIGEDPDISGDADESAPVRFLTAPTGPGAKVFIYF